MNAYNILSPMGAQFGTSRGEATQTTTSSPAMLPTLMGAGMTAAGMFMNPMISSPAMGMGMSSNPGLSTALNPGGYYVPPNLMVGPYRGSYGR